MPCSSLDRYAVQPYGHGRRSMCVAWEGGVAMHGCAFAEPRLRCVLPFEAEPSEVRLLRRATVTQLGQWGMASAAEEAELVVTELATNVIKHVGGGASATLILEWHRERLRVEVHDKGRSLPTLRRPAVMMSAGVASICLPLWRRTGGRRSRPSVSPCGVRSRYSRLCASVSSGFAEYWRRTWEAAPPSLCQGAVRRFSLRSPQSS
ncbi:ATP-binding protein [Streptomyces rishiriensis]|uniref:ATP-binding protein n=1 Tax=Streptomyces rishiriensis TaxID=68264 RepID=UPI0037D6C78C